MLPSPCHWHWPVKWPPFPLHGPSLLLLLGCSPMLSDPRWLLSVQLQCPVEVVGLNNATLTAGLGQERSELITYQKLIPKEL